MKGARRPALLCGSRGSRRVTYHKDSNTQTSSKKMNKGTNHRGRKYTNLTLTSISFRFKLNTKILQVWRKKHMIALQNTSSINYSEGLWLLCINSIFTVVVSFISHILMFKRTAVNYKANTRYKNPNFSDKGYHANNFFGLCITLKTAIQRTHSQLTRLTEQLPSHRDSKRDACDRLFHTTATTHCTLI